MLKSCLLTFLFCLPQLSSAAENISVHVVQESFNPSAGQSIQLKFTLREPASVTASVVYADGLKIQNLLSAKKLAAGEHALSWNGSAGGSESVVPNGVYFIEIHSGVIPVERNHRISAQSVPITANYYDKLTGALTYTLARPGVVSIEAGRNEKNPETGSIERRVLKTIVNHQPRSSGTIYEHWNGYTDQGEYLPKYKDLFISIQAHYLSSGAVIVYGGKDAPMQYLAGAKQ